MVSISRFRNSARIGRFVDRFGVDGSTPLAVAKTWACLEAIVKAEDRAFEPDRICIRFPQGQRPCVEDPHGVLSGQYILSVSHEKDFVIAVAQRCN
jgi:phosphopantetheinyl transferase (holo-ACP synthase)